MTICLMTICRMTICPMTICPMTICLMTTDDLPFFGGCGLRYFFREPAPEHIRCKLPAWSLPPYTNILYPISYMILSTHNTPRSTPLCNDVRCNDGDAIHHRISPARFRRVPITDSAITAPEYPRAIGCGCYWMDCFYSAGNLRTKLSMCSVVKVLVLPRSSTKHLMLRIAEVSSSCTTAVQGEW
jgi:hypothetical protein